MALFDSLILDFGKICRLCLCNDRPLSLLFSIPTLNLKITECVGIEVKLGDKMPDKICSRCLEQLENWMKFKELCVDANTTLLLQSATEIHQLPNQINESIQVELPILTSPKKNDILETPSDFPFKDVSLADTDSLFKNNIMDESTNFAVSSPLDTSQDERLFQDYFQEFLVKSDTPSAAPEDKVNKCSSEEQQAKWREKYTRVYRKKYHCGVCNAHFSKLANLLEHDKTEHEDLAFHAKCLKCGLFFVSNQRLELHNTLKHKEKIHECETCGVKCSTVKSLKVHKLKHSEKFQCDICPYSSSSNSGLQNHKLTHSSFKNICCQICSKRFKQRQALTLHMKLHALDTKPTLKCNVCYKKYPTLEVLQEHQKSHRTDGVVCDFCGLKYKNETILRVHRLTHKAPETHCCEICDKSFSGKRQMSRHLKSHYKLFICEVCNKSFTRADSLEIHMNSHRVTVQIQCEFCEKKFSLKRYYVRHLERKHGTTKNV